MVISKIVNMWNRTNRWHRVIVVFMVTVFGILPQRKGGFYCNDESLSHPYTGDTISWKLLIGVSIFLPLAVIIIVEAVLSRGDKASEQKTNRIVNRKYTKKWCEEYSYGLLLNMTIVQVIKIIVGEPRPHFFDVCQPDSASDCQEAEFVTSYTCTNSKYSSTRISDAGRSFPSGHTSIALHAGVFLAWYLYKRLGNVKTTSFNLLLAAQLVLVLCSVGCGISRITDRRHHWWDVLAGAFLGAVTIVYSISACKNFDCASTDDNCEPQEDDSSKKCINANISEQQVNGPD